MIEKMWLLIKMMSFFFFNDTATTEIYTLSLHDALPICCDAASVRQDLEPYLFEQGFVDPNSSRGRRLTAQGLAVVRSEEHTSELQSRQYLVCRLLLEKKQTPLMTSSTPYSIQPMCIRIS